MLPVARRTGLRLAAALLAAAALAPAHALFAAGTYAEGWAVVRLVKVESGGIFFDSWEGELQWASFDSGEDCNEKDNECFTPTLESFNFSIDDETKDAANFMRVNVGKEMLIRYKEHLLPTVTLGSSFEVLEAKPWLDGVPEGLARKNRVDQSGGRRNFSVFGRVLRLESRGTAINTWEGLYLDATKRKVHPFSITDDGMAEFVIKAMASSQQYHFGISVAYVATIRDSNYDIFEINYDEPAGGIE